MCGRVLNRCGRLTGGAVWRSAGILSRANWLKQPGQPVITDFSQLDIHVLKVTRDTDENPIGFRPYQYRIATGEYPLIRSVYVINTDPRTDSNVRLFYFYLKGQKGQTIICNSSQLLPYSPVQVKPISVR